MGVTTSQPVRLYALEDIPGKGKGLIATKPIRKGTRILSEKPILALRRGFGGMEEVRIRIHQQVSSLRDDEFQAFHSMENIHPYANAVEQWLGIVRTNALPMGPDLDTGGVFLTACRINHACDNNAQNFWNENIDRLTIHAVRDIRQGEEITISYLKSRRNRRARQEELQTNFKFVCRCRMCCLPADQSRESDARLDRIHEIDGIVDSAGAEVFVSSGRRMLSYVDEQVRLWNEEGAADEVGLARAYPDAFQIAVANGDLARGRVFAERVLGLYLTTLGEDSPDVVRYRKLAKNPAAHDLYGTSMGWKTRLDDIPHRLEPQDFEDWLWRRKTGSGQGRPTGFHNREVFLSFDDLPDERERGSEYFECDDDTLARRPVRHWCFLGEIEEFDCFVRLRLLLRDVDGASVPVFFHTHLRGGELAPSLVQKGHTVAILYAVRHAFLYGEPGIRHEDTRMIKIFPVSLDTLLNVSDEARASPADRDALRTCHACGKKGRSMKRCGRCTSVWYCDRACQKTDFVDRGHKAECKVLRDPDWKALLRFGWDEFDGAVHFPLRVKEGSRVGVGVP